MRDPRMSAYFLRQLADYAKYHRNQWNCAMHVFGILSLFLAAVIPLSSWRVHAFGAQTSAAAILVLPVLIYWVLLDAALGLVIIGAAVMLLSIAEMIVNHASTVGVWIISTVLFVIGVVLQVVGHQVFERRQPALLDNPTHLLLGPIFMTAKLFIALGFRHDLAAALHEGSPPAARSSSLCAGKGQRETHPES
jgi:uncharacterized membrane protein YGL010W